MTHEGRLSVPAFFLRDFHSTETIPGAESPRFVGARRIRCDLSAPFAIDVPSGHRERKRRDFLRLPAAAEISSVLSIGTMDRSAIIRGVR
ncbi:MAG: hypothetical protein K2Z80_33480 [Xanthobacteraceae bacterium]|nr:hypothetical protein [Xanthobacteraceae bacterium]